MNQKKLIQHLAELSGIARSILIISENSSINVISNNIVNLLDGIIEELQDEETLEFTSRFQAFHPCEHQWISYKTEKGTTIPKCEKCGEFYS